ncbi:putative invasion protein B [Methylobacterium sp. 4-46]|uniref:invasion associated locus B family protein n=1 Tax=unclassified Methylobacterium TaxID=2615210 RepID=UPI000152C405|nr:MULTISPECIES: invasion associated locus B family protein [Methylobacterium]ACA14875.1 putative invasion protein B [Methylobacterium sp. 4-46]WFT80616.1 invasion associated locus B family protein [Methylobacterium nodulans]
MRRAIGLRSVPAALAAALGLAGPVLAQPAPKPAVAPPPAASPAAPPVPAEPELTTASFGEWTLRCQRLAEGEKVTRFCEVAQAVQVQGQAAPLAQVALGRAPGEAGLRLTAVLPVTVSFPSGVRVGLEGKEGREAAALDLAWRRCLPAGCVADGATREDVLKRWRAGSEPGRLTFKDAAGRDVTLPLSFRGLDQALEALAKERA